MRRQSGRAVSRWNWAELRAIRLKQQDDTCAICRVELDAKTAQLDHDHKSGKVRGALCFLCNAGLGQFADNPTTLLKAIQYLNKWNKQAGIAFLHDDNPDARSRPLDIPKDFVRESLLEQMQGAV